MKHRWIALVAVSAVFVLGACTPADSGPDEASEAPISTTVAEPSATPTPYAIDEY